MTITGVDKVKVLHLVLAGVIEVLRCNLFESILTACKNFVMQQMDITTGYRKACVVVEVVGGILRNRDRDPVTSQGLLCYRDGLAGIGDLPDSEGSVPEQYRITVDGDLFKLDIQDRLNGGIVDAGSVGGDLGVGCGVVVCDLKRGISNWVGLTIRLDYGILRDTGIQR